MSRNVLGLLYETCHYSDNSTKTDSEVANSTKTDS